MVLGQLVAISVATNLFFLALSSTPHRKPEGVYGQRAPPILWFSVLGSLITVGLSPFTTEDTFLTNLLSCTLFSFFRYYQWVTTFGQDSPSRPRRCISLLPRCHSSCDSGQRSPPSPASPLAINQFQASSRSLCTRYILILRSHLLGGMLSGLLYLSSFGFSSRLDPGAHRRKDRRPSSVLSSQASPAFFFPLALARRWLSMKTWMKFALRAHRFRRLLLQSHRHFYHSV